MIDWMGIERMWLFLLVFISLKFLLLEGLEDFIECDKTLIILERERLECLVA